KWKGSSPKVELVTKTYETGIKLTKAEMQEIENQIQRLPELGKWFVDIYHDWF
ncbi:ISAzo13-like element transposase-related protein, partial [Hyella patelloides]|uniref:ISAzo13-like element transposase-related protein n=1 Tax=Hyella patelloides TaxID=1982969 RepID=UPI003CCC73FA